MRGGAYHLAVHLTILRPRYSLVAVGIQRGQMSGNILLADDERTPSRHRTSAGTSLMWSILLAYVGMLTTPDLVLMGKWVVQRGTLEAGCERTWRRYPSKFIQYYISA